MTVTGMFEHTFDRTKADFLPEHANVINFSLANGTEDFINKEIVAENTSTRDSRKELKQSVLHP